ncbi:hypothetical protein [Pedobacter ureilyticus]|uniref:Uncharacterized protein n=1 Tax=Pedobacter ureilyticus TaxID=1393051 RepID=A0ABW9J875_9SPHI|nr:hypothetical protein [Pedobacter helvus]
MKTAIIRTSGMPVTLAQELFPPEYLKFDVEGFLIEFVNIVKINDQIYNILYKYYQHLDFKKSDRDDYPGSNFEGYVSEELFLQYVTSVNDVTLSSLKRFDFLPFKSEIDTEVEVDVIHYAEPFNEFYRKIHYKFKIEAAPDGNGPRFYKNFNYLNQKLIDTSIIIPSNASKSVNIIDRENSAAWHFYKINFGDVFHTLPNDKFYRSLIKKYTTLIDFKITQIVYEAFPRIFSIQELDNIDSYANSISGDTGGLDNLSKVVFFLKKCWGFYYDPLADSQMIHRRKPDPVLYITDETEVIKYYSAVVGIFDKIYIKGDITNGPKLLYWLLEALPQTAINALPYESLFSIVKNFLAFEDLDERTQRVFIRLIIAVNQKYGHINEFLEFLLTKGFISEKPVTYFEKFYRLLTDARKERLTIVNWFVNEQTNRKYFAYAIFDMWKISKYNWDYFPPGIPNPGMDSNYLASYWLDNDEFNPENIIEFVKGMEVKDQAKEKTDSKFVGVDFLSEIFDKKINIRVCTKRPQTVGGKVAGVAKGEYINAGCFHLYQPISLINYEGNIDLKLPRKILFPSFLVHFIKEYDELADFDALISLFIDVTIDVGLFFATGGAGAIKDLKYLKYVTKLGRALRGTLPATESVAVWRGATVAGEVVTMTAGELAHINNYLITEENDPEKRKALQKTQVVVLSALFLSGTSTLRSSYLTLRDAPEALNLIRANNIPVGQPTIDLLEKLKGKIPVLLALHGADLSELNIKSGQKISNVVQWYVDPILLNDEQRLAFMNRFKLDLDELKELNVVISPNDNPLINWLDMFNAGIKDAAELSVVTNTKVTKGYLRFYPVLEEELDSYKFLKRFKLMDAYGTAEQTLYNSIVTRKRVGLDLLATLYERIKINQLDQLTKIDVENLVKSSLDDIFLELLTIKNESLSSASNIQFVKQTNHQEIDPEQLVKLFKGELAGFDIMIGQMTASQAKNFRASNKMIATIDIYNGDNLIRSVKELYISGKQGEISKMLNNISDIPDNLILPHTDDFELFKKKAFDFDNKRMRTDDTEIKFLFNFLEQHWYSGNKFTLKLETMLHSCPSCQAYLVYLKRLAFKYGKEIDIQIISNKNALTGKFFKNK